MKKDITKPNIKELEMKGEAARCKKCGNKIWIYWHTMIKGHHPEMDKCANCYFEKR